MIDWLESMAQTYEFYEVNPGTWKNKRRISSVLSCNPKRDKSTNTIESASFTVTEKFEECYIRVYLVVSQDGITYPGVPLGTFLVQTPSDKFDGKISSLNLDAYSPLLEAKDVYPEVGYTALKGANIMDTGYKLLKDNLRAPIIKPADLSALTDDFTAESSENLLDFVIALIASASYHLEIDDVGQIIFAPDQDLDSVNPVWTFADDGFSILYSDITDEYDLYGIPNMVEVIYSNSGVNLYSKATNDNPVSPTSTVARGRTVMYRESNPTLSGTPTQEYLDQYAQQKLKELNSITHTLSYQHGYCPVRLGDCVLLDYESAGLKNVKARIQTQSIDCTSGCTVSETAVYTSNLLEGA